MTRGVMPPTADPQAQDPWVRLPSVPLPPIAHPMLLSLLAAAFVFQGPQGVTAAVDDPLSHGLVGDAHLSLDEAIRLANGTLARSQLSALESLRLSGAGTVDHIAIDPGSTPTITVERPLTPLTGQGAMVHIEGGHGASGTLPHPVLLGGSQPVVLTLHTHDAMVHALKFVGGQVAVEAQMGPLPTSAMVMAMLMHCQFDGQTTCGVRVAGSLDDETMLMIDEGAFTNLPVGVAVDDQTGSGRIMIEVERSSFDQVTIGGDVTGAGNGQMSMLAFYRSRFQNGQTLARMRRTSTSVDQFMWRFVHCEVHCLGDVTDIQGSASGLTMVHHHASDFVAGQGRKAFWVYPRTAEFDVHGSEMLFEGDVVVTGNRFSPRCWQQNNEYHNGTITYDVDGSLPNLLWNRYDNCTLLVPPTARSPVAIRSCELRNTQVDGQSTLAPVTLQGCWRNGGSLLGQTTETRPAPTPFLGTTTVSPPDPQLGTSVRIEADLPFGIGAYWHFAIGYARPVTTMEPFRLYGDPALDLVLPALVLFQSRIDVPVPNLPTLAGLEFYVQAVSVPLFQNTPWVPVYHLPRGGLIKPRM